ncbi:MAG: response regulator, partial [Thermoflexaceae bacterium]|nr:response regulator [Thermoflexaceae bacterium]
DGMEALREIKEQKLCPETPVIVLTANAVAGEKEMYLNAGFTDYLSKPIFGRQLKEKIRFWLPDELVEEKKDVPVEWLPEQDAVPAESGDMNFTGQLEGILDTATGLAYCCDSEEFYKEMLCTYLDEQKYDSIEEAYQKQDWENYRILVHALKSTSLSIGAGDISEQAKALEMAAKENNIDFIREHHTQTMENYCRLLSHLHAILQETTPKEQTVKEQTDELPHILVVDDDIMNLRIAEKMLKGQFQVDCVDSGKKALKFLQDKFTDLILLDLHMPDMDGFEVMRQLRTNPNCRSIPVIFLTADDDRDTEVRGFKEGALDFIKKPFVADIMIQRVSRILQLDRLQKNLQQEVEKQTFKAEDRRRKVERLSLQIMRTLAGTIDAKDKYTNGHSTRVAEYAREIAKRIGKNEKEQEDIYYMGLLHDIGKIGIPDEIINKTSKLTDEEYAIIKSHPIIGSDILKNISEIPGIGAGARWHHERFDGMGYPDKLKGEEIPEGARIIGVADTYDAMASKRSYRDVLPQDVVRGEIEKAKGSQLDPYLADVMLAMIDEDTEYRMREL